jgi:pullulanase
MTTQRYMVQSADLDNLYCYDGADLGNTYSDVKTDFRLWAPTAEDARLITYTKWDDKIGTEIPMIKSEKGTWIVTLLGNHHGLFYTYNVLIGDIWNEATDPCCLSVSANGGKSAVIDLKATIPEGWNKSSRPILNNATDAIIYELHVRDLSIHPDSGIKNKGKFLGLTETETTGPKNTLTGLAHIKDLGVTHVQLLPIFDYGSVDETLADPVFNWGYDPENYNSPEGSYATDPFNPVIRVKELKLAIQALHNNNLGVIMDVVYNHMYNEITSNFNKLVPGYYFRYDKSGAPANESGCGNVTASEHKMMRKFIVDSVSYWAKEYNLDGFRFDLMGLHDVETMNQVRTALNKINPNLIIIGEGWDMGNTLPSEEKANQKNVSKMPGIGFFNDIIRDGIKGSTFKTSQSGFINGNSTFVCNVKKGIVGAINYSDEIRCWSNNVEPGQSVNYSEAHDNNTLWDKLLCTNPMDSEKTRIKMHRLAAAIVFTSQGIPFFQAGQEFLRTKKGDENSFASGDEINRLDWALKADNMDTVNYFKGLIALRKSHPAFRMPSSEMIKEHLKFIETPEKVIAYTLDKNSNGDKWNTIVVAFNSSREEIAIKLPRSRSWKVVVNSEIAGTNTLETINGDTVRVPPLATIVVYAT